MQKLQFPPHNRAVTRKRARCSTVIVVAIAFLHTAFLHIALPEGGFLASSMLYGGEREGKDGKPRSEAKWRSLFDGKTLDGWEAAKFGGEGEVGVEDGKIVMEMGTSLTGITYKGEVPKTNYEIRVEAMQVQGIDFFCGLTFPVADSHCSFIPGGWAGSVVGLSSIDDKDASENETTKFKKFDEGTWYRFRVQVRPERIQVWIDGKKFIDQNIKDRKITTRPEVDLCKPLGIASWETKAAIRKIEIRRLKAE